MLSYVGDVLATVQCRYQVMMVTVLSSYAGDNAIEVT
jgi:hypothetical protein